MAYEGQIEGQKAICAALGLDPAHVQEIYFAMRPGGPLHVTAHLVLDGAQLQRIAHVFRATTFDVDRYQLLPNGEVVVFREDEIS